MQVVLLGCPGAGKGTQAKFIAEKYHIPAISTGDIFRAAIQQKTELGKKVKMLVEQGQLVPDDMVIQLVQERIKQADCKKGFLLDGFPRTLVQAKALQKYATLNYVIDIEVPEDEIVKRLSGRRIHPASGRIYHIAYHPPRKANQDDITGEPLIQRPDDHEETVRQRLAVYQSQTSALKDYYQQQKNPILRYVTINGMGTVDEIKQQIFSILRKPS